MKILKPILYCLLGMMLAFVAMYFLGNKKVEKEIITDKDIPTVELQATPEDVYVGDTVTYTVKSRVQSNNEAFDNNRTFYYDFTGDGTWDLVTKKDSVIYIFDEIYEDGITPRAAVEFRGKIGMSDGNTVYVKSKAKPILLYNSIGNIVIFRDLSRGKLIEREICFETDECKAGNSNFKKTLVDSDLGKGTESLFSDNDSLLRKYGNYGGHNVSIYLKDRYGNEEYKEYIVKTSNDTSNGKIASGINMITIPETIFTNGNLEVFLSKVMNDVLIMYINYENEGECYVDVDISTDSNGDGESDNDIDVSCNEITKIVYQSDYESAVGRIYFTEDNQLIFKNFYVTFEGYILELDEENVKIYNDISTLINGIEDISVDNIDLKIYLDALRKNLNSRNTTSSLVVTIQDLLNDGNVRLNHKQKGVLDSILNYLSN